MISERHMFVGPSMSPELSYSYLDEWTLHPPAQRGDIARLIHSLSSSSKLIDIAIVDGLFYSVPAVGHQEILDALARGHRVFGLSSMGAIRAAELHSYGMQGYGKVYSKFMQLSGLPDDTVTQLHGPAPTYQNYSEPFVNLDEMLLALYRLGEISADQFKRVRANLLSQWYGARNWEGLFEELRSFLPEHKIQQYACKREEYLIKSIDLRNFLEDYWLF